MVTATGATRNLTTRPLVAADLQASLELSRAVAWPHRLEDWQFVHTLGDSLAVEEDGVLVGTGMCWHYGAVDSLGMVIVAPDRQGRGIGRRLMDGLLEIVGDRGALLQATPAGLPLYEKLGFRVIGHVNQHQSDRFSVPSGPIQDGDRIRPVETADAPTILALDLNATGLPRAHVLSALAGMADGVMLERDGTAAGFAFCRRFGRGHAIGPVVAPDTAGARALIGHWMAVHRGTFLRIDLVESAGLSRWVAEEGLPSVSLAVAMARGKAPQPAAPGHLFAIINQALG